MNFLKSVFAFFASGFKYIGEHIPVCPEWLQRPRLHDPSEKTTRQFTRAGWVRGYSGCYRRDDSLIFKRGSKWVRQDPAIGEPPFAETEHKTLKAALEYSEPLTLGEAPAAALEVDANGTLIVDGLSQTVTGQAEPAVTSTQTPLATLEHIGVQW